MEETTCRFVIDRIEEDGTAVCEREDGSFFNVPICEFGFAVQESDCICVEDGQYIQDTTEKMKREQEIETLMGQMFT